MNRSPRVAKRLLSLILPERIRDAVLGDLEQEYAERAVPSVGTSAAGRWYWLQALRAIPYALRFRRIEPDVRPLKGDNLMGSLIEDIRYALRGMRKSPGFTTIALVTLALGIGANTAVFSVVQAVLLRPLPYEEPERLVVIWGNLVNRDQPKFPVSPFDLRDYREQATLFEGFTGVRTFQRTLVGGGAQPEQIQVADVTPNFSSLLGVLPILGRAFEDSDAVPIGSGGDPATLLNPVLLDHSLWQRRFGSDPTVIGQTVEIAGNTVEIVGVMPPGTQLLLGPNSGVATEVDAWMTPRINLETWGGRRQVTWRVIARLKPGVTVGQAQAEMDGIANRIRQEESVFETAGYRLDVFPMIENLTADIRPAVMALLGAVGFVLLIACANVGNLMLVRASNREREIAIRAALGGRRRRLLRQLLVESTVLGLTGGALGLLLAYGGMELLLALKPANLPRVEAVAVDGNVLGFTLLASLAAAIIFGTIPAMQASKPRLVESLKDGGRIAALSSQRIFRNGLIVTEIALSVVLLVGAGLMVRSFIALERVDPGYDPVNVLTFEVSTQGGRYNQAGRIEFNRLFRERAAGIPGVTSVSAAFPLPLQGNPFTGRYGPTEALTDETLFGQADYRILEPGYFETMKTRLLAGRVFDQSDFTDSAEVTVIDETLARILWPGVSAVGQRLVARTAGVPTMDWRSPHRRNTVRTGRLPDPGARLLRNNENTLARRPCIRSERFHRQRRSDRYR